ncbi:MAG: energy-coupling factor transporter transmembrane protein EcfT [Oscillospiraceae bacterium]|nr:energy-coupling factor transporter transmembrane protein EcfT [Oscillospiraceae bacterium]
MLKDITLGQYFPGNTPIHRLDPRTKILLVVIYIVALFVASGWICYGIVFLALCCAVIISKIKLKSLFKGLRPLIVIIIITAVLNIFYTPGETVLIKFWIITVTLEGLETAFFMVARIVLLVLGSLMLTYTTSPIMLTDGLEGLLKPLKLIHVPVHELSMMMSIALRFIPTLIEETQKIMNAQKSRGAQFDTGGIIAKAKAMLPILVPLFISSFRRADELATAMEARCYHGGEGRTKLKVLKMKAGDFIALGIGLTLLGSVITLKSLGI